MGAADWILLSIIAISLLVGVFRGFVKEVLALVVWAAAFYVAYQFSPAVAGLLDEHVTLPSARSALAFGGLFVVVLIIGGLCVYLIGKLVEKTGLSGTDRLLGGIFGAIRGLLLIMLLVLLAEFTPVTRDDWWGESKVIQSVKPLADWASEFLPESIREHLGPEPETEADTGETEEEPPEEPAEEEDTSSA